MGMPNVSKGQAQWVIFVCMFASFPVVYYLFFDVGIVSLSLVYALLLKKFFLNEPYNYLVKINIFHAVIYTAFIYGISVLVGRKIDGFGERPKTRILGISVVTSLVLIFLPIYGFEVGGFFGKESLIDLFDSVF